MSEDLEPPSRAFVRALIKRLLRSDSELEAFCLDHFAKVHERFTNQMDRLNKVNLLFELAEAAAIVDALIRHCGKPQVDRARAGLEPRPESAQDPEEAALRAKLEELYAARAVLQEAKQSTAELDREIVQLKRRLQKLPPQLCKGEVLANRYRLEELIGSGKFAKIWRALHLETHQYVAVKVLRSEHQGDLSLIGRFYRGAKKLKELQHPYLLRILDGPAAEDGFHYFVMELLSGGNLEDVVIHQRLPRDEALRALLQAGEALDFAHRRGLIHRDIQPQNILLDGEGHARLGDFDLVQAADSVGGTLSNMMLGSFLYAAPEQQADAKHVDPRADVYSLALTAQCILARRVRTKQDLLQPEKMRNECPEPVRALLRSATAMEPSQRPPTALVFCSELRKILLPTYASAAVPDAPKLARSEPAAPRVRQRAGKSNDRRGLMLGLAGLLVSGAGAALLFHGCQRSFPTRRGAGREGRR